MKTSIKHITIQAGQTLADIAIQEYGTVEGMALIMQANPGIGVSDALTPGQELVIWVDAVINRVPEIIQAVSEYQNNPPVLTLTERIYEASKTDSLSIKTITVQAGQTLPDIAIQEYGTVEAMILIMQANPGINLTDALTSGSDLIIWSSAIINRVSEIIKSEPYASQLQNTLMSWISLVSGFIGYKIWVGTKVQRNAIAVKDPKTIYLEEE